MSIAHLLVVRAPQQPKKTKTTRQVIKNKDTDLLVVRAPQQPRKARVETRRPTPRMR